MDSTKTKLQELLKRNMTRQEFLGFIGMAALIVLHVDSLLHLFDKGNTHPSASSGYSSDGYSGFLGTQPPQNAKAKGFDD